MLIQRRPGASTISTRGSSRSGARSATRDRAARRPKGDRGRLGMARTERLVGRRQHHVKDSTRPADLPAQAADSVATIRRYIAVRIQRGGGTGPLKPRQPSRASEKRWQFHQAPIEGLGDAVKASPPRSLRRNSPGGGFSDMPADALKCKECSTSYPLEARYVCERCFGPLEVAYRAHEASAEELKRRIQAGPHTLWRYADFLPLQGPAKSALPTGWTPLVKADRLAERLGLGELYIKNETANPTHSFKDRVVSIALARAQELGFQTIACASTGNLANAVAAHAAAAGLPAYVLIPADLEEQKILATGAYGTNVVAVKGNYDA